MGLNITQKLISSQLLAGEPEAGQTVSLNINQTLAHDVTAPLVLSHFEVFGLDKINCDLAAFYIDQDILPQSSETLKRHRYIRALACRIGAHFSRPGNGTCHHVHLERMATPGRALLGADGETQTLGAVGMLAFAADAVEVAAAMAGTPHQLVVPPVLRVLLHGKPKPFISPKDIALELLRRRGVGGTTGYLLEFDGPGARALGVYERATIANIGSTLGAVTTVFPSDEKTKIFLQRQRRSKSWRRIEADNDAEYQETESVDLAALEPMCFVATENPSVRPVRELQDAPIDEVIVGSCANASVRDLLALGAIMRGKKVNVETTFMVSPSSRQALEVLARGDGRDSNGALADLISAGVRILESGRGSCQQNACLSHLVGSVRTFIDVPEIGELGTIYVTSPETAAASAVNGQLTDPRKLRRPPRIKLPRQLPVDDSMIIKPSRVELRDDNAPTPALPEMPEPLDFDGDFEAQVGDFLGDHALLEPAAPSKGNTPREGRCYIAGAQLTLNQLTPEVALSHRQMGLQLIIAEDFAPPTEVTLANAGVLPLRFRNKDDANLVKSGDRLSIESVGEKLRQHEPLSVAVMGNGTTFEATCELDERTLAVLVTGGLLEFLKKNPPTPGEPE